MDDGARPLPMIELDTGAFVDPLDIMHGRFVPLPATPNFPSPSFNGRDGRGSRGPPPLSLGPGSGGAPYPPRLGSGLEGEGHGGPGDSRKRNAPSYNDVDAPKEERVEVDYGAITGPPKKKKKKTSLGKKKK